jgi:thiol:disulfide interchange protein DsbD
MRKPDRLFAWPLWALVTVVTPAMAEGQDDLVRARLIAEDTALEPGATAWLAVELVMKPGWHTYWRNPGDAGQATEIDWTLPQGYAAGPIHWPVPKSFTVDIITSYGYADRVALLVPVTVPADARDKADIAADVRWLVCEKICIPGEARLALSLPVAAAASRDQANATVFSATRGRLPRDLGSPVAARYDAETIALQLPPSSGDAMFLPFDDALIEHGAKQAVGGGTLTLRRGPRTGDLPASTDGVLLIDDGKQAFNVSLRLSKH